jgi:deoxyribodipyrimidine photolyase-related protein
MKKVGLIFPHQLFKESEVVANCDTVYILEEELFFTKYSFHKQKLVLHRASMKYYADFISSSTTVKYIQSTDYLGIEKILESQKENEVHCYHTDDYLLERRINRYAKKHAVPLVRYTNPNFINPESEVRDMLSKKATSWLVSMPNLAKNTVSY